MKFSLRTVLVVIATLVAVAAAIVAFLPLYNASLSSADAAANLFSDSVARGVRLGIQPFFDHAQIQVGKYVDAVKFGSMNVNDNTSVLNWMLRGTADLRITQLVGLDSGAYWVTGLLNSLNISIVPPDNMTSVSSIGNTVTKRLAFMLQSLTTLQTTQFLFETDSGFNMSARPYYVTVRKQRAWFPAFVDVAKQYADLLAGAPLVDPATGNTIGVVSIVVLCRFVVDYLKVINVATNGRVALIDVATKSFIGGNFVAPTVKVISGTTLLTTLFDVTEPLIQEATTQLGSTVFSCMEPCNLNYGHGTNMRYVRVEALTDDFGLNLRLLVVIPSEDFLGDIRARSNVSLGAAAGAVVGLVIIAAVIVGILMLPLHRLEDRLYASASLEDNDADQSRSFLSEIASIEEAYAKLQAELKKVKSFLPQSVLRQLEQEDDDEEEGDVAIEDSVSHASKASKGTESLHQSETSSAVKKVHSVRRKSTATESHHSISSSERRKRTLTASEGAGAAVNKRITMISINLVGLHAIMQSTSVSEVSTLLAKAVELILGAVNSAKGVLESMSGDHFVISLNASTNCASHGSRGAALILALAHQLDVGGALKNSKGIQIGAASGNALCGNFGTDAMKRFSILGNVVNHAIALMQMARSLQVTNLVNSGSNDLMHYEYELLHCGFVTLPQAAKPAIVSTLLKKKESQADEWMYELHEKEGASNSSKPLHQSVNEAFELIAAGDSKKAKEILGQLSKDDSAVARGLAAL